jgi:molecular chaperone DnaK
MEGGEPTVIPSAEGGRTIPSVVAFTRPANGWLASWPSARPSPIPQHRLLDQALPGPSLGRPQVQRELVPYRSRRTPRRRRHREARGRQNYARDQRDDPQTQDGRRPTSARRSPRRSSRSRPTRRHPAPGDQGCRADRGPRVKRIIQPTASALAYGLARRATRRSPSTTWAAAPSTSRSSAR